jgi:stringent starvation protein B
MTSNRPYLIRAFYDWIVANGMTPYITVDATVEGSVLPQPYVRDGQIILNISRSAPTVGR